MSHRRDYPIGATVELHPATDDWMRGDRYGTIVGYGRKVQGHHPIKVKLHRSGRTRRYAQSLVTVIDWPTSNPRGRGRRPGARRRNRLDPQEILFGDVARWASGLRRGDRIVYMAFAGYGRRGPEFKEATGTVALVGPAGPVVTRKGDRYGAQPVVVTRDLFVRKLGRRSNPSRRPRATRPRRPSKKARAYIGRKVRKLAHEGVPAPQRVAAAYGAARRRGFRVPPPPTRRKRRNDPLEHATHLSHDVVLVEHGKTRSLWWHGVPWVVCTPTHCYASRVHPPKAVFEALSGHAHRLFTVRLVNAATVLSPAQLETVARGGAMKANPQMLVLANPPGTRGAQRMSRRVMRVDYEHVDDPDGPDVIRFHDFSPSVHMEALADGSVRLYHPSKPIWVEDGKR